MPIVLSYEDIDALGTLAYEGARMGAEAEGNFANRQLAADIGAQRDATAAQLQGISSRERIANQQMALQASQFASEQEFRAAQLSYQDQLAREQMEAGLQEAGIRAAADLQSDLLGAVTQQSRDERLHQQRLTEIERRAELSGGTSGRLSQGGVPDRKFAQGEAQQYGNLIPYDAASQVSPEGVAREQKRQLETAQGLSSLPTNQLISYLESGRIQSEWQPYVQAVLQSRQAVGGGRAIGAQPNGRDMDSIQRRPAQGLGTGRGLADDRLGNLSNSQLQQLADDPAALNRFFGAPP